MISKLKAFSLLAALAGTGTGTAVPVFAASAMSVGKSMAANKPFTLVSAKSKTLSASAAANADQTATKGMVSADKKTLSFTQKTIRLIVHTGPNNDMLSYRIAGLRNPTLVVPRGAMLNVLFVNNDEDMLHNVRFGAWTGKFSNSAENLLKTSVGAAPLPHLEGKTLHGAEMAVKAPFHPGKYAYFCTVRGHAQGGMWGTIQVR